MVPHVAVGHYGNTHFLCLERITMLTIEKAAVEKSGSKRGRKTLATVAVGPELFLSWPDGSRTMRPRPRVPRDWPDWAISLFTMILDDWRREGMLATRTTSADNAVSIRWKPLPSGRRNRGPSVWEEGEPETPEFRPAVEPIDAPNGKTVWRVSEFGNAGVPASLDKGSRPIGNRRYGIVVRSERVRVTPELRDNPQYIDPATGDTTPRVATPRIKRNGQVSFGRIVRIYPSLRDWFDTGLSRRIGHPNGKLVWASYGLVDPPESERARINPPAHPAAHISAGGSTTPPVAAEFGPSIDIDGIDPTQPIPAPFASATDYAAAREKNGL